MPIVDNDKVVGIVTRVDIVRMLGRDDRAIATDVWHRLEIYGGLNRWKVEVHDGVVSIVDVFDNSTDRHVATVLARAVPGVVEAGPSPPRRAETAGPGDDRPGPDHRGGCRRIGRLGPGGPMGGRPGRASHARVDETITITTDMPAEPPVPLLTDLSRTVRMVVVGHTGDGGFTGMLVASTAAAVVIHAHCPVLVIRGRFGPGRCARGRPGGCRCRREPSQRAGGRVGLRRGIGARRAAGRGARMER